MGNRRCAGPRTGNPVLSCAAGRHEVLITEVELRRAADDNEGAVRGLMAGVAGCGQLVEEPLGPDTWQGQNCQPGRLLTLGQDVTSLLQKNSWQPVKKFTCIVAPNSLNAKRITEAI